MKESNKGIDLTYFRFKEGQGNIGIRSKAFSRTLVGNGLQIAGMKFQISEMNEEENKQFWEEHGERFKLCVKPAKRDREKEKK